MDGKPHVSKSLAARTAGAKSNCKGEETPNKRPFMGYFTLNQFKMHVEFEYERPGYYGLPSQSCNLTQT